ncbi:putative YAP-binding/ALF4/Glomulin [Plasmopara halstedii]
MSGGSFQSSVTQLLHRQTNSQQHGRRYTFAATIANRFFSDNSLDRQNRVVECAKRRQARARDRALQQACRVKKLEVEFAEAERVKSLKEEREVSRMRRKLEHVAAAYLQYIWRRYCQLKREANVRKTRAERLLVDFFSYRSFRRKSVRRQASFQIQKRYREYRIIQRTKLGFAVLASTLLPLIRKRRARRHQNAVKLQSWYRQQHIQKRENSVRIIQRAWRISVSKAKLCYFSRAYHHLTNLRRLERSACVIQRTLGKSFVQRRLLCLDEFREYPCIMTAPWPPIRPAEEQGQEFWLHKVQLLQAAIAERKRLAKEETSSQVDIQDLQQNVAEAKTRLRDESDRYYRHAILEEHRRQKEEEAKELRMHELEGTMRKAIRLELEHELETARRLMVRSKRHMGKEDLLEAFIGLQTATSVEDFRAQFVVINEALNDIQRKRWKFLEDACFNVLRNVFKLQINNGEDNLGNLDSQKLFSEHQIDLCLQFLEPLIDSTAHIVGALDDEQEAAGQRGVLVAALLYLFEKAPQRKDINLRLIPNVLKCGVDIHVFVSTLRFREELVECQEKLLPLHDSDSEDSEVEDGEDKLELTKGFKNDDFRWISERVAEKWGFLRYRYFLATYGQEYAFTAWSSSGVASLVHAMLTEEMFENALSAIVSPLSWLFLLASYAHCLIKSNDQQERFRGLELLRVVINLSPEGKLAFKINDAMITKHLPFREQAAVFCDRDWISPLIQVITNAMVSFPEASHRSAALAVLKGLVLRLVIDDRFWILRDLIIECPYGNVAAILMDFVRNDTVQAWSSIYTLSQSPFKTSAICSLLYKTLAQAAERDLVLQADLIASTLSLLRFLYIRDKDNTTGLRSISNDRDISQVMTRINKRLHLTIQESAKSIESDSFHRDFAQLLILEASLASTLEQFKI